MPYKFPHLGVGPVTRNAEPGVNTEDVGGPRGAAATSPRQHSFGRPAFASGPSVFFRQTLLGGLANRAFSRSSSSRVRSTIASRSATSCRSTGLSAARKCSTAVAVAAWRIMSMLRCCWVSSVAMLEQLPRTRRLKPPGRHCRRDSRGFALPRLASNAPRDPPGRVNSLSRGQGRRPIPGAGSGSRSRGGRSPGFSPAPVTSQRRLPRASAVLTPPVSCAGNQRQD